MVEQSKRKRFLNIIKQIESSGGKDLNHKILESGMHKGDAAMGEYGIMPKTAEEFIKRREMKDQFGPDEALMRQMDSGQLKEFLADQDRIEQNLADDIATRVLKRSKGDEEKAAYMWNQGHNKLASSIDEEDLDNADYIKKFRKLKDNLGKNRSIASKE